MNRVLSTILALIGAIVGGILGYILFFWIVRQGFLALMLPGASIGLGCGLLARHRSILRGVGCAIAAIVFGLYTEWVRAPFVVDKRFSYMVQHAFDLPPITLIMIGLGAALAYYLGKDAGFVVSRGRAEADTTANARTTHDLRD